MISVANTTIHGAGGLNKPTMCLLSLKLICGSRSIYYRSYWYPSGNCRQFRTGWIHASIASDWLSNSCPATGPQFHPEQHCGMKELTSLFNQSRHHEVIACYIDADLQPNHDPNSAQIAAASYFRLGKYQNAYNILVEIYSSFDDYLSYLSLYAASCRHLSRLDESMALFTRALTIRATLLSRIIIQIY